MSEEYFNYEENQNDDRSFEGSFSRILKAVRKEIRVQYPAKVIKVNNQDSVDIEFYSNGVADTLSNVPVKHLKSPTGFFIIKIKKGDKGVVSFFDDDIDLYRSSGVIAKSDEKKVHDINDNLFEYGFYPDSANYQYPDGDVIMGTNEGALISMTGSDIKIIGGNIKIENATSVNIGNNTIIDGQNFLQHTHYLSPENIGSTIGIVAVEEQEDMV